VGLPLVVILDERAVRGVGALINDFFGVSFRDFLVPIRLDDDIVAFEAVTLPRDVRLPVTNGCRKAA